MAIQLVKRAKIGVLQIIIFVISVLLLGFLNIRLKDPPILLAERYFPGYGCLDRCRFWVDRVGCDVFPFKDDRYYDPLHRLLPHRPGRQYSRKDFPVAT